MENIIVCNTANDSISEINIDKMNVNTVPLKLGGERIGPRSIDIKNNLGVIANCYSDSITFIDLKNLNEIENYKVGKYPKDIKWKNNYIYIVCGDSNSIIFFNEKNKKIDFEIKVGDYPSSLDIDKEEKVLYVANTNSNSISVIDNINKRIIKDIQLKDTPTKVVLSDNEKMLYVCENSFLEDMQGYLRIYNVEDFKIINEYKLGAFPSDIIINENIVYTSNLGDGSISVLNLLDRNSYKLMVGGMPKSILKIGKELIISDYYRGRIILLDEGSMNKKIIAVGSEPNAMIVINQFQ